MFKYLLYGIGEIILVVIGILIALQVNNWKEASDELAALESIYENLYIDIQEDLKNFDSLKEMLESRAKHADFLLTFIDNQNIDYSQEQLVKAMTRVGWILNYTPTFATYHEITNTGKLSLISSTDLKRSLADYKSQIGDNRLIEEAYNVELKALEKMAISFFRTIPVAENLFSNKDIDFENLELDIQSMIKNQELIDLLKHVQYFSSMEIEYKNNLIIPRANSIKSLLEIELKPD